MYLEMLELPKQYSVIALSNMNKVRAAQLMKIRKRFYKEIKIIIIKNKVTQRAFEKIEGITGLKEISEKLDGQCALMFTKISPFKLNLIFDRNKVLLAAKGGDITKKEIMVPSGNTGITPGPVLSEFKEANVPTKIDQGTIWINKDTIVVKQGGVISQKIASLLSKLNIKPIEAGISVNFAISEGLIFTVEDLKIDLEQYIVKILKSHNEALSLCIESGYLTPESIIPLLQKAFRNAQTVVAEAGYISPNTVEIAIASANVKAQYVVGAINNKGYTIN